MPKHFVSGIIVYIHANLWYHDILFSCAIISSIVCREQYQHSRPRDSVPSHPSLTNSVTLLVPTVTLQIEHVATMVTLSYLVWFRDRRGRVC